MNLFFRVWLIFIKDNVKTSGGKFDNTDLHYPLVGFCMAGSFKRWVSDQTFIAQDPDAPQVHLLTVSVSLNHLRREVVQCPTHGTSPGWFQNEFVSRERRQQWVDSRWPSWHSGSPTLVKVRERTNQNLQFSALHDSREAGSLAWCHDESLSSRGSTAMRQIFPPCTGRGKRLALNHKTNGSANSGLMIKFILPQGQETSL